MLAAVLAAAHILPGLNTWVAAVGDDGDVKGGRYVSGVYDLVVGQGAAS